MKAITFTAIKGGIGKSSLAILTANYLNKSGYKVLCIDLDIQNSLTFYYLPEVIEDQKDIARALHNNDLLSNIVNADIDIIPSNFDLINLRAISINKLKQLKEQLADYDFVIIDTAPTVDNIVLNAVNASDFIITPFCYSLFDFKSALFFRQMITTEIGNIKTWHLLANRYKPPRSDNKATEINQYIDLFNSNFDNILNTKIHETAIIQKAIDTKTIITRSTQKERLYNNISELVKELLEVETTPESF